MSASSSSRTSLILASASVQREQLLRAYGFRFRVMPPPIREPDLVGHGAPPQAHAEALSYFKARSVLPLVGEGAIVISADTLAALGGVCFGKPSDRDEARLILSALSGTTHEVITGVTLLHAADGRRLIQHEATAVTMRPLREEEIERYLDTDAWKGKAGAYGIQADGEGFVERISGSFSNVVGLPMELLTLMLREWGVERPLPSAVATHGASSDS